MHICTCAHMLLPCILLAMHAKSVCSCLLVCIASPSTLCAASMQLVSCLSRYMTGTAAGIFAKPVQFCVLWCACVYACRQLRCALRFVVNKSYVNVSFVTDNKCQCREKHLMPKYPHLTCRVWVILQSGHEMSMISQPPHCTVNLAILTIADAHPEGNA